MLQVLEARIDHSRVVSILRKADHLPLVKDYLIAVQKANLAAVNDAVNELLIEEEDFKVCASMPLAFKSCCLCLCHQSPFNPSLVAAACHLLQAMLYCVMVMSCFLKVCIVC